MAHTSPRLKNMPHNVEPIGMVVTRRLKFEKIKLFVTGGWSFKLASWDLALDKCIFS